MIFRTTQEPLAILLTLAGLAVGSFVGLVSVRLPLGRPVILGRSHCPSCGRTLGIPDLVPLLSFLVQHGRCRACGAAIDRRYPLIETGGALVGLVAALALAPPMAVAAALLGWWLTLLAILDWEHFWLPRALTVPLVAAGLAVQWLMTPERLGDAMLGAVAGWLALACVALLYRRIRHRDGLGGGDAVLFAAAGAWLGWRALPLVLVLASWSALAFVLATRRSRRWSGASRLPFGCFLAPAIWLAFLATM